MLSTLYYTKKGYVDRSFFCVIDNFYLFFSVLVAGLVAWVEQLFLLLVHCTFSCFFSLFLVSIIQIIKLNNMQLLLLS